MIILDKAALRACDGIYKTFCKDSIRNQMNDEDWSHFKDFCDMMKAFEAERTERNEKIRVYTAERRKTDKNYGRPNKDKLKGANK